MRLRLPSRNWLIFLSLTGSFTTALLYDKQQKRKAQQKWCNLVSHLAQEPLPVNQMPRRITIFLSAPPGDGLRSAREYFQEYVKPILVSAALDWDVVEGRREGEVRAGLAEKIRRLRRKQGEVSELETKDPDAEAGERLVSDIRQSAGIRDWDGIQGDLIIGRHTWKEYVRGLHEGWLGPLDQPPEPPPPLSENSPPESIPLTGPQISSSDATAATIPAAEAPPSHPEKPQKPPGPTPPYVNPSLFSTSSIAATTPTMLSPSTPLPFPHLLGFLNTPTRIYRFLTRRHLADKVGHEVATLVLAAHTRPYQNSSTFSSSIDPDSPSTGTLLDNSLIAESGSTIESGKRWEQQLLLDSEEQEWHKIAHTPNPPGEEGKERVWLEEMVIDERIGVRMRAFELGSEEDARAKRIMRGEEVETVEGKRSLALLRRLQTLVGWNVDEQVQGWEQGLVGDEGA